MESARPELNSRGNFEESEIMDGRGDGEGLNLDDFGVDDAAWDDENWENDFGSDDYDEGDSNLAGSLGADGWSVINPTRISENETEVHLSADDLLSGVFLSSTDAISDATSDEDYQVFLRQKEKFEELGYTDLEEADFDTLDGLAKREENIDSDEVVIQNLKRMLSSNLLEVCNVLSSSKSTDNGNDPRYSTDYIRNNISKAYIHPIFKAIENRVEDEVTRGTRIVAKVSANQEVTKGSDITIEMIVSQAVEAYEAINGPDSVEESLIQKLISYTSEIVPKITKMHSEMNRYDDEVNHFRKRVAKQILSEEISEVQKFVRTDNKHIHLIRNLYYENGRLLCVCPNCKNKVFLNNMPLKVIKVITGRMSHSGSDFNGIDGAYCISEPLMCKCEDYQIFKDSEYIDMFNLLIQSYKFNNGKTVRNGYLADAASKVESLCEGASFLKVSPAADLVSKAVPYLLREEDTGDNEETSTRTKSVSFTTNAVLDDLEFQEAVRMFYEKLKSIRTVINVTDYNQVSQKAATANIGYNPEVQESVSGGHAGSYHNTSKLSYKQLAACMVDFLSMDYSSVKTQAIFSLCFYISENPLLDEHLNRFKIWELENDIALLSDLTAQNISILEKDKVNCLLALYAYYCGTNSNLSDKDKLLHMIEYQQPLIDLKHRLEEERKACLDYLETHAEMFGYCKMVNVSSYLRQDIDRYVNDQKSFEVFDSITDLMIINNLAGDYYDHWAAFGVLSHNSLQKALVESARTNEGLASVKKMVSGILKNYQVSYPLDSFNPINIAAVEEHSWLRDAYGYYKQLNLYKFCKSLKAGKNANFRSCVDDGLDMDVKKACDSILKKFKVGYVSEVDFYLKDFSQTEINQYKDELEMLPFGRFILKRINNETPAEYASRFLELDKSGKLNVDNSYDYLPEFEKLKDEIFVISAAVMFSSIEYESYPTSVFMERLIKLVKELDNQDIATYCFNLDDEYLNSINNNIEYFTHENLEISLVSDFYRIGSMFYFTPAADMVDKLWKAALREMVRSSDGLLEVVRSSSKMAVIENLFTKILKYDELFLEDRFYSSDDISNEVCNIISGGLDAKLKERGFI